MKLIGKRIALFALLTLALTLLCTCAFAELEGNGTQSNPYLVSSIISGQDMPIQTNIYFKNDLSIDLYIYTDAGVWDVYFCQSDAAPYTGCKSVFGLTQNSNKLTSGETTCVAWGNSGKNLNSHNESLKLGFYGDTTYRKGGKDNPIKLSELVDGQALPNKPYVDATVNVTYYYVNDLGRKIYLFSDNANETNLIICATSSCDVPKTHILNRWKNGIAKNESFNWFTMGTAYSGGVKPIYRNMVPAPVVPSTGDSTNLTLLVLLAAAALVGMTILSCKKRCLSK